jgi:hypothetical protein
MNVKNVQQIKLLDIQDMDNLEIKIRKTNRLERMSGFLYQIEINQLRGLVEQKNQDRF